MAAAAFGSDAASIVVEDCEQEWVDRHCGDER